MKWGVPYFKKSVLSQVKCATMVKYRIRVKSPGRTPIAKPVTVKTGEFPVTPTPAQISLAKKRFALKTNAVPSVQVRPFSNLS